jgi:hypothetical protein
VVVWEEGNSSHRHRALLRHIAALPYGDDDGTRKMSATPNGCGCERWIDCCIVHVKQRERDGIPAAAAAATAAKR